MISFLLVLFSSSLPGQTLPLLFHDIAAGHSGINTPAAFAFIFGVVAKASREAFHNPIGNESVHKVHLWTKKMAFNHSTSFNYSITVFITIRKLCWNTATCCIFIFSSICQGGSRGHEHGRRRTLRLACWLCSKLGEWHHCHLAPWI